MRQPKRMRPKMDAAYSISTDEAGMLTWEWVEERLAAARNYWIVTTRPDGSPHAAPVWGVWVGGTLYWSTSRTAVKARNLTHNPKVVAHLESGDQVVILEGRVQVIDPAEQADLFKQVTDLYAAKYALPSAADEFRGGLTFALAPKVGMAWLESDFPTTAARFEFPD